jgi:hypothetical protein
MGVPYYLLNWSRLMGVPYYSLQKKTGAEAPVLATN